MERLGLMVLVQALNCAVPAKASVAAAPDRLGEPLPSAITWLLAGDFNTSPCGALYRASRHVTSTSDSESGTKRCVHPKQKQRVGDLVLAMLCLLPCFIHWDVSSVLLCICTVPLKGSGMK